MCDFRNTSGNSNETVNETLAGPIFGQPRLRPVEQEAPVFDSVTEQVAQEQAQNRRNLLITATPLALAVLVTLSFLVGRTFSAPDDKKFGAISRAEAGRIADTLCLNMTGEEARVMDATQQAAFSCRRQAIVREWDVVCDTADGQYLLRINADTKRVYAVNRLQGRGTPGAPTVALDPDRTDRLSRAEAAVAARRYLSLLHVPTNEVRLVEGEKGESEEEAENRSGLWNFTFRRHVDGLGDRMLKVSVNSTTGGLEHVWNPVSAM